MASETIKGDAPLVSVLIASYQSGEKLYEAVQSVLRQDYPKVETVVCDDGSADFDERRLRSLVGDGAFHLIRQEKHVGTVRNLNGGLAFCSGEWILLLAADDVLAGDTVISGLMERAERSGRDWLVGVSLLCDGALRLDGSAVPTDAQIALLRSGDARQIWIRLCHECFLPSSGTAFRRDLLKKRGGFDERYCLTEDWPLFLNLVRSGNPPEALDLPVVLHRSDGVSRKPAGRNQIYQRDLIETMRREVLPYLGGLPPKEQKKIRTLCRDKRAIYQFRFETAGPARKAGWVLTHLDVVIRKSKRRSSRADQL